MKKVLLSISLCIALIRSLTSCIYVKEAGVPEPGNGYVFKGITAEYGSSTLTITTVGTGGHYFILDPVSLYCSAPVGSYEQIRFKHLAGGSIIKFYAHGESTVEIQIPLGEYEIYYATGETWYGEEEAFGKDTIYSKCEGTFDFSNNSQYTLHIPDGNFFVYKIEANEFPNW